ncbi:MAG: N-acetylmuramoyl-L-alanine amidase, partial [Sphingomonadales bacterium]
MMGLFSSAFAATVSDVRLGENAGKTRFVLDVSEEISYSYFLLADPYRIVIDLEEVTWGLEGPGQGTGKGIIRDYRFGLFQPGKSRIVLDLKDPADVEKIFFLPPQSGYPHRLVIDLTPVRRDIFLEAITKKGGPPATYVPSTPTTKIFPKPSQRTIVIDAGHGGVDPGTIGSKGQQEKNIVLATALAIKEKLESSGNFRVLLTRDTDVYIPHRQRFEYARNSGADLFISIHADAAANKKIRGATVYTLSENASDKETAALARRENKSDLIAGIDLGGESTDVANILV